MSFPYSLRSAVWFWIANNCVAKADQGINDAAINAVAHKINLVWMAQKNAGITLNAPIPHSNKEIHMKHFLHSFGMLLLMLHGLTAHAELKIDNTQKPELVYSKLNSVTASRQRFDSDKFIYSTSEGTYLRDPSNAKRKYTWFGVDIPVDGSNFGWLFNGKSYLSSINSYNLEEPLPDKCNINLNPNANCNLHENGVVCHLFLYDSKTVNTVAIVQLNIKRDSNEINGMPACSDVKAMAVAKEIPDTMLITLGYFDSASHDSEPTSHLTTLLLRFSNENSKLKIEQDDSCLGNPNKYATITAARRALKQCVIENGRSAMH